VSVQLLFQHAMALARMGDITGAQSTMLRAEHTLPYEPGRHENHFEVDPPKLYFYATKVGDILGHDRMVAENASNTLATCLDGDDTKWPMRVADVQLALAHMQVRAGNLDGAVAYGLQALSHDRVCAPTLLGRASELLAAVQHRWPGEWRHTWPLRSEVSGLESMYAGADD
jgi:hypothetical protein